MLLFLEDYKSDEKRGKVVGRDSLQGELCDSQMRNNNLRKLFSGLVSILIFANIVKSREVHQGELGEYTTMEQHPSQKQYT
jgi:hypothetical protein